jgi:alpha-tubulin suppressor-like RCC1 family protein
MILTKENKLYVFGSNNYYQLGVKNCKNIYSPMSFQNIIKSHPENLPIDIKSNITTMKFSGKNALLLNESGNLIILSCFAAGGSGSEGLYNKPVEVPLPDVKFSQIECGKDFCLLIATSGHLYSFGSNQFGQLGHGDTEPRTYPTVVKYFLKKRVDQISCGFKHAACKSNNKIYTWGCNVNGQLGTGNLKHMYTPNLNDIKYSKVNSNFLQVSCGFRSTVFLTETRQLYWCGTCGDIQQQLEPIEFLYNIKIPELFSYDNHVIVKINHTWSKTMSILYATVAEVGPLKHKLNNPNKMNKLLNSLTNKWIYKDLFPPRGEDLDNYIAEKHIIKDVKATTVKKKNKK